ncbi:hypothetical protein OHT93_36050 [Streptomyces sp. NBC_00191]|uniref:hypothetical protein n=1 Tax=Streptomyces sp. NBC_00191 TaxID=2975674 RepID=UPI003252F589
MRIEQGRLEEGLADFLACGARTVARSFYPWWSEAALVHARLDHAEEAVRLAEEEVALARRWGVPEMTAVALRALGIATGGPKGLRTHIFRAGSRSFGGATRQQMPGADAGFVGEPPQEARVGLRAPSIKG